MKKIFTWLGERGPQKDADDRPTDTVLVEDVVMPDIYGDCCEPTVPDLKVIDLSSPDIDKCKGFDPYDTAVLKKK